MEEACSSILKLAMVVELPTMENNHHLVVRVRKTYEEAAKV